MRTAKTNIPPQFRLREQAPRALTVIERHRASHPGLELVAAALARVAAKYMQVFDAAVVRRSAQTADAERAKEGLAALQEDVRVSVAALHSVAPEFDPRELQGDTAHPDRLFSDARKVLEMLAQAGAAAPSGDALIARLEATLEQAHAQSNEARAARVATQQDQAVVREHAQALNAELVNLRRVLRVVLGSTHHDYRALRTFRPNRAETNGADAVVATADVERDAAATSTNGASTSFNGASLNGASHA